MGRRDLTGRRILLTGASSGIGRALAIELARRQSHLLLIARRAQALTELVDALPAMGAASAGCLIGDVTDAGLRERAVGKAHSMWEGLDLLVNCAGVSAHGRFADGSAETLRTVMETNFFSAVELTRLALPLLVASSDSVVVNIGSILGHRGVPHNNEYCGSKFALRGWSEAVRPELWNAGIDMLQVSPGTTETGLFDSLVAQTGSTPWNEQRGISPEQVARQVVRALERRKQQIYPNWRGRALVLVNRYCPGFVNRLMRRYG
ncbi:MAG: SDR family NAD(P)-dependent oxidoreductase [Pirellulales bacterium]|nr:SDR family NAD(P)-dependent oxidoreductase [Pirellulales bacterium]